MNTTALIHVHMYMILPHSWSQGRYKLLSYYFNTCNIHNSTFTGYTTYIVKFQYILNIKNKILLAMHFLLRWVTVSWLATINDYNLCLILQIFVDIKHYAILCE